MENLMQGQANRANGSLSRLNPTQNAANLAAALRTAIEGLLATSETITDLEYQTAAQRVNACQSVETLQKWFRNCIREVARREEELPTAPAIECATAAQREEIAQLVENRVITRREKAKVLHQVGRLTGPVAVALIGDLYQKILDRGGIAPASAAGSDGASVLTA